MKGLPFRMPFPLLRKELTEQAARRRTYVVRALYALLLFACFFLVLEQKVSSAGGNPSLLLGSGRDMFDALVGMQFAGIFIFLPAMMSGVVAYEKERESLSLLFLTALRPWEILLEKYLGRLVPMFTFFLLSLPLLAICYAFGGVPGDHLLGAVYMLVLAALQVGAFGLMWSAFCATTAQAFVCSYVLGAAFYFGEALLAWLNDASSLVIFPPFVFYEASDITNLLARSIPIALSAAFFLVMARVFLVRRAFVLRRSVVASLFRRLDVFWNRANRLAGGIVLIRDKAALPEREPVAWRELNRRSLGKASHQVRLLLMVSLPILVIAAAMAMLGDGGEDATGLSVLLFLYWPLAVLVLCVQSVSTFVSERTGQTLDVLLTTPIAGEDIVRQKVRALRRLGIVLAVPIVGVVLAEARLEATQGATWPYLAAALSCLVLYLPLTVWLSLWIGLKCRSRPRAIITALAAIVAWCAVPTLVMLAVFASSPGQVSASPLAYVWLLSPSFMIFASEFWRDVMADVPGAPWLPIVLNAAFYGTIVFLLRYLCLDGADRYLGRIPQPRGVRRLGADAGPAEGG
jgi:ABC-type transport system involved in multi-copper enzyme maturation permease subunit